MVKKKIPLLPVEMGSKGRWIRCDIGGFHRGVFGLAKIVAAGGDYQINVPADVNFN